MTIIAGGVSFAHDPGLGAQVRALAERSRRYDGLAMRLLLDGDGVACHGIRPARGPKQERFETRPDGTQSVMVGHVDPSLARPGSAASDLPDGRWIAMTHAPAARALRLGCDRLGTAWLYLARTPGGYLFSSDFGALARTVSGPLRPDEETVLAQLALGYAPDDATCLTGISILPPGRLVELRPDGAATLSSHRPAYGDRYVGASRAAKFERLDELFTQAIATWCPPETRDLVVSLSGGYDSRYGLALLHAGGLTPGCVTWGHPKSHDARVARELCERLGLDWTLYDSPAASWEAWERTIQQGGAGGFQWGPSSEVWLERLAQSGSTGLLGFLGDALSGKHLVEHPAHPGDWSRNWDAWSLADGWAGSPLLRPGAQARMTECLQARFEGLAAGADIAFPHQRAMHLDLFGRQRRFTVSQANLMARFLSPSLFFYTQALLEFWGNLPYEDLRGQRLYLDYARHRFPDLFHDERPRPTIAQRAYGSARNLVAGMFPSLRQRLVPTEIDLKSVFVRYRREVRATLSEALPELDGVLDSAAILRELEQFPMSRTLNTVRLLRLLNVCALLRARSSDGPPRAARGLASVEAAR